MYEIKIPKQGSHIIYTVKKGDTLWSISNKFNCKSIAELKFLNDIKNEKDIVPGTKLRIYNSKK